jgi:transmembrane sensor
VGASLRTRLAASIAVIGAAVLLAYSLIHGNHGYTTAIGEQRTIELVDGSVLQLNSKSRIETKLSATGRDIQLLQGEATFKVTPDPARPFRVHAGGAIIQAIGTQFNVNQRPSGITVSVIEGRVRISGDRPAVLGAGEEARVGRTGGIERRGTVDPQIISAWRQHRLVFRDDTLEDIVAEFNRYNANSQIRLEGDAILARRYTAVFDANDPASLVAFLRQDAGLAIDSHETQLIVRTRTTE